MVHCGIWDWCIVGFIQQIHLYYRGYGGKLWWLKATHCFANVIVGAARSLLQLGQNCLLSFQVSKVLGSSEIKPYKRDVCLRLRETLKFAWANPLKSELWNTNCSFHKIKMTRRVMTTEILRKTYTANHNLCSLKWRHNGHDSVSNHQPHDCLLNRLFSRRSKKISKLRVTGLCAGNSPETGEFPAQMVSNAEMFPFHDVIMFLAKWPNQLKIILLWGGIYADPKPRLLYESSLSHKQNHE